MADRGGEAAHLPKGLQQPVGPQGRQPLANLQDQALILVREPAVPAGHLPSTLPLQVQEPHLIGDLHHLQ